MTGATTPQLHLELLCARILLPTADDSTRGVGARVDRLERRINLGTVGAVAAPLRQDPAALTTPETPAEHAAAQAAGTEEGPGRSDDAAGAAAPDGREAALAMARRNRPVPPGQQTEDDDAEARQGEPGGSGADDSAHRGSGAEAPGTATPDRHQQTGQANTPADRSPAPGSQTHETQPPASRQHSEASITESPGTEDPGQYQPQPTAPADADQVTMIQRSWADVVALSLIHI